MESKFGATRGGEPPCDEEAGSCPPPHWELALPLNEESLSRGTVWPLSLGPVFVRPLCLGVRGRDSDMGVRSLPQGERSARSMLKRSRNLAVIVELFDMNLRCGHSDPEAGECPA